MFSRQSGRFVDGCQIFHVRSGFGNSALERARESGAICLVDHSAAAPNFLRQVDEDIYGRWGDSYSKVADFDLAKWTLVEQDIQNADHIIANSGFVKRTLEIYNNIDPNRISVVPMGVNTDLFRPREQASSEVDPFTILSVGGISYRKGVYYLIEAYKKLNLPNAKLVLVGAPGDAHALLKTSEGDIDYIPHLPHTELVSLYQSGSVFVFPSLAEGSALVTYEAMASGLPLVTTFEAGSVVRDGLDGFIVPAKDVDALAEKIHFLYNNRDIAYAMGKEGRQSMVENYTWQNYADNIVSIYRNLLKAKADSSI